MEKSMKTGSKTDIMARGRRGKGKNQAKRFLLAVVALVLAAIYPVQEQLTKETGGTAVSDGSTLEVHYLDIGQGDCTLIRQGDHAMLIDAGNNSKGTKVQAYLENQGINHLDYVIGTHPDADHIGGLDVIIYKFDCDQVWMPDYSKDTRTYDDVIQAVKARDYKVTHPKAGDVYTLGEAEVTVVCPVKDSYGSNANDYSIGVRVQFGENSFVFTGDAEEHSEEDMVASGENLKADVYKAAHHGSRTANTENFIKAIDPRYVVFSCGEGNTYGHPHAEVLDRLRKMGIQIFRTDDQGTVVAVSDGQTIAFNTSPSDNWTPGEPKGK